MANIPLLKATVTITSSSLAGDSVAKVFRNVLALNYDYNRAMVNVVDVTGSFFFPLTPMTTVTYTITSGLAGQHTVVMS